MLLKLGYLLLTIVMLLLVGNIGFKTINKTFEKTSDKKRKKYVLVIGLLFWQLYLFIMASSGVMQTFDLPPRFPLLIILPAFLFIGVFIFKNRKHPWLENVSLKTLTYIQVFRVAVELLFVYSISAGVLHKNVTIEGYNFDMLFALTAPVIAYLAFKKQVLSRTAIARWNYLGLAVLASVIFVFFSSAYAPQIYGADEALLSIEFTKYPYIVVAGFLMPLAVFFHILSLAKLSKK